MGGDYHFTAFAAGVLLLVLLLAPTLAGAVMGARAWAHELETGTALTLFGQGVQRTQWWTASLVILGVGPAVLFGLLGLLVHQLPADSSTGPGWTLSQPSFLGSGPVLGGYYFLAFGIAVLIGVLLRNVAATIVVTLALQVVAGSAVGLWLRPSYLPPVVTTIPIELLGTDIRPTPDMPVSPDFTLGYWHVRADGSVVEEQVLVEHCMRPATADPSWTEQDTLSCQRELGVVAQSVAFQPVERWRVFQLIETVLVSILGLAAAVGGLWRLGRLSR
ncbi:hypothetical protein FDO65_09885 [Nakamurella flava]|uniref:ABC transporter permease n=1 Tax=Nakamurella flava TaxID=2576308 RepID=A0A4U6QMD4_9ACTN|nr:hypothetical protein [Nakamurella flava]TKV61827.1 hypothetical protein FDO65_09885 [Nakamurella flava]